MVHAFAEYGKEGVLALFQDSTNVERKGYTPSERAVRRKFDEVFARTQRRLFISCFSSSIHRIKLAVELAHEHGRKVAFIGRSMTSSAEIAADLGYMGSNSSFLTRLPVLPRLLVVKRISTPVPSS